MINGIYKLISDLMDIAEQSNIDLLDDIATDIEAWVNENNNLDNIHDWIVDNWEVATENINFNISTYLQENPFDPKDIIDKESLAEFISDKIQEGILNVVDSYKEVHIPEKVTQKTRILNDRMFYIAKCPRCHSHLDYNRMDKFCSNCGQKLNWEE